MLPLLACAVCPVCLSSYAKLLSVLGVGLGLSEMHHHLVLSVAITFSIAVSAWRSYYTRRIWPVVIAVLGSLLMSLGHVSGDVPVLEWAGVLVLLGGGAFEHLRLRLAVAKP